MTLFRNATDLDHWYVRVAPGWLRFPARANGWHSRRRVRHLAEADLQHLQQVPQWLAFNTGMPGTASGSKAPTERSSASRSSRSQRVESIWRNKLSRAEQAYVVAFAESQKVQSEYDSMAPSDGNFTLRKALKAQNAALGEYVRVLQRYTQLILRGETLPSRLKDQGCCASPPSPQ